MINAEWFIPKDEYPYEKVYYFQEWSIPKTDFITYFDSSYVGEDLKIEVGGQSINDDLYNIFYKNDDMELKGEVKYLSSNSPLSLSSKDWKMEDLFNNINTFNEEKADYIEVEIPLSRVNKMREELGLISKDNNEERFKKTHLERIEEDYSITINDKTI